MIVLISQSWDVVYVLCFDVVLCSLFRELLWTLSREELWLLEKSLCSTDDATRADLTNLQAELGHPRPQPAGCESTDSPSTPVGSDIEDDDNVDPANMAHGVMVHSDSTMTVVERVNLAAVDTNGLESDEDDDPEEGFTNSSALDDVVARQLQHSKSWPKTTHRGPHKPDPPTTEVASSVDSGDENSDPSRATEGQQSRSHHSRRSGHEFNFNLPYNTGSQEALAAPVSLEVSFAHVHETNLVKSRSRKPGFIYIAQSEDEEEDNSNTAQQISFITDAFCQLFNPNTPIGNAVVRLKSGANWAEASAVRDGATTKPECSTQSENGAKSGGGGNAELETSYNGSEGLLRHPPSCRRWFSMPAGDTSSEVRRTDALVSDAVVCDITDSSAAADDRLPLDGVAGLTPTSGHNYRTDSVSGLSLDAGNRMVLLVTQTDTILSDASPTGLSHLKLSTAACGDLNVDDAEALSAKDESTDAESESECVVNGSEILAAAEIAFSAAAAEDVTLALGSVTHEPMENWSATQSSVMLERAMQSPVLLESATGWPVTQPHAAQTRNPSAVDNQQRVESSEVGSSLSNRKVIGNSGKRKIYSRTGREDVSGDPNRSHTTGRVAGRSAANWAKAETGTQPTSAVEQNSCYTCLEYDWDRERYLLVIHTVIKMFYFYSTIIFIVSFK